MSRGMGDFALRLVFSDWRVLPVAFTGFGLGASIVGHVGIDRWSIDHTFILVGSMIVLTIITKFISFAYKLYTNETPYLQAVRFVKGDGLNEGSTIIVFSSAGDFYKGQLVTLFCESSGAKQPILIAEIIAANASEVQAISITKVRDEDIRKYFEEESRRRMLYATSEISLENIVRQGFGDRND